MGATQVLVLIHQNIFIPLQDLNELMYPGQKPIAANTDPRAAGNTRRQAAEGSGMQSRGAQNGTVPFILEEPIVPTQRMVNAGPRRLPPPPPAFCPSLANYKHIAISKDVAVLSQRVPPLLWNVSRLVKISPTPRVRLGFGNRIDRSHPQVGLCMKV